MESLVFILKWGKCNDFSLDLALCLHPAAVFSCLHLCLHSLFEFTPTNTRWHGSLLVWMVMVTFIAWSPLNCYDCGCGLCELLDPLHGVSACCCSHQLNGSNQNCGIIAYKCTVDRYHSVEINSLAPGRSEWNFRYVISKWILVIDGWVISCEIALIWMSLDFTDDQSTLVQIMAWCL